MRYRAQDWYQEKKPKLILDDLLDRIYLLRCQLVHGAATSGGQLNRTPLRHCTMMLNHLLQAVLLVLIDHGADEDWGELCYPPLWSAVPKRPVPRPPAPQPQRL